MSSAGWVVTALIVGLLLGALASASGDPEVLSAVGWIQPVGELWVNAIRMTVVPLVVALMIGGVASVADLSAVGRLGGRTLITFVLLLLLSAALALIAAPPLFSLANIDPAAVASHKVPSVASPNVATQLPSLTQWLTGIVPTNPIKAAADGAMLPLVVFTVLFALGIMKIGERGRATLLDFFHAIGEAMLVLVRWIIRAAPAGVFALALGLAARLGGSAAGMLGLYVLIISGLCLVLALLMYPIAVIGGNISLTRFAKGISAAQVVAVTTRSSLASLPALLEAAHGRLMLPAAVSGFTLPLSVAVFKSSTPITQICGTLLVSRLYGIPISATQLLTIAAVSVFLSFSAPGIPSGGLLIMAPVFAAVGLPVEGIGILIAVDIFPDAAKTLVNVTSDAAVATVVANHSGEVRSPPRLSHAPATASSQSSL